MEKKKIPRNPINSMPKRTKIIPNPYKEIAELKDGIYQFNFTACRAWVENLGKQIYGPHFQLYQEDTPIIYRLIVYAIADKAESQKQNLDLQKGILLSGPVGCGKTSMMSLIKYFFQPGKQYQVKSTREIGFEFEKEGYKVISRYSTNIFCFDDLGVEQPQKYFGNDCNVMAEILLNRYELFVSMGILTHLTTNLSASEIEEKYGNRIRSRMREMFNLVAFDKDAGDKRI